MVKVEEKKHQYGAVREKDLPWNEKKVMVFKLLRKLGETTASEAAKASNGQLLSKDIRHYCYHAAAAGLIEVNQYPPDEKTGKGGLNVYYFKLTKLGMKVDPDKELAKRKADSDEKAPKKEKAEKVEKEPKVQKLAPGKTVKKAAKK